MLHFPNCKINLGLQIGQKRADGFHEIDSILYPLPLRDALETIVSESLKFESSGIDIPGDTENNIVLKAYHLLKKDFALPAVSIHLLKKIPTGAGLGGGSADGTEMLKLLNQLFELNISDEIMTRYALQLGSDCPFFVKNIPALAKGRGEILTPISLDLHAYHFAVVKPDIHISTAWAFSQITPAISLKNLAGIIKSPIESWRNELKNDFEPPIFEKYPRIGEIKNQLYASGAVYASMSGSGSAVYGIFREKPETEELKFEIKETEVFVC